MKLWEKIKNIFKGVSKNVVNETAIEAEDASLTEAQDETEGARLTVAETETGPAAESCAAVENITESAAASEEATQAGDRMVSAADDDSMVTSGGTYTLSAFGEVPPEQGRMTEEYKDWLASGGN